MADVVVRENKDGVAYLTLTRPEKLNALNVEIFQQLERHLNHIEKTNG